MRQYDYEAHGHWVRRDSTGEEPSIGLVGSLLTSVMPLLDEMAELVGVTLCFGERELTLRLWEGEINTSPGP